MPLTADCKAISAGPDDTPTGSYLKCATAFFGNPPVNNDTQTAITNLSNCIGAGTKSALIIGHGNVGFIKTGNGNQGGTNDQILGSYNRPSWLRIVLQLKNKCSSITLLACDTGADDAGADLVYFVATAANCTVYAPTYLVYCGGGHGVYLDPKAQWQSTGPGVRPKPIPKPSLVFEMEHFVFGKESNRRSIPLSDLHSILVTRINLYGEQSQKTFEGAEAEGIARLVDFSHPVHIDAVPASVLTGKMELRFNRPKEQRSFIIHSDDLLEDEEEPGLFYYVNSSLALVLARLL